MSDKYILSVNAIWCVIDEIDNALHKWEQRAGHGGQHVSYHGPFAAMTPSVAADLRRVAGDLRHACGGRRFIVGAGGN